MFELGGVFVLLSCNVATDWSNKNLCYGRETMRCTYQYRLESRTYHVALFAWSYVQLFWYNTGVWQTHTHTLRRTDTRRRHIPCLA